MFQKSLRRLSLEPLHNLNLSMSKILKECEIYHLGSDELVQKVRDLQLEARPFSGLQKIILRGCKVLLGGIE